MTDHDQKAMKPPLEGIRILDFTRVIAGPLCTQQLADLGAEVIKIEHPITGDDGRRLADPGTDDRGPFFLAFNRSKRSVAVDLQSESGQELLQGLLAHCDVLIENYRPGVMAKAGLDYSAIRERHPNLIYVSISAYGQDGPAADRPGMDPVLQAESGMMSLTGEPDGEPMRTANSLIDTLTAAHAATAILAALHARRENGHGTYLDLSLLDTVTAATGNLALGYLTSGRLPARTGNAHVTAVPTALFQTATGPLYVALATDRLFRRLCLEVFEDKELADDPRFATARSRLEHREALAALVQAQFLKRPRDEWLARMRNLPAGAVRTLDEALESEEVRHRQLVRSIDDADGRAQPALASPLGLPEAMTAPYRPAPHLGEHTDEVLAELLELSPERLQALRAAGAIR